MSSNEHNLAMFDFRSGRTRILVTTDGISFDKSIAISLTVNYDLPIKPELYVHRVGRSGRFGRKGLNFFDFEN